MLKTFFSILLLGGVILWAQQGTTQNYVASLTPSASAHDIASNTQVVITFTKEIDAGQFRPSALRLTSRWGEVASSVALGSHGRSVILTPNAPLRSGVHHVSLLPLKLHGTEKQVCHTLWNRIKAYLCELFGWFCDRVCYEEVPLMSKPIAYDFSVTESAAKAVALQIIVHTTDLNESQSIPIHAKVLFDDNSSETVSQNVTWKSSRRAVAYVKNNQLIAKNEGVADISARYHDDMSATVRINVYKTVDGYRLPHEVDERVNNATLLGIDANKNGVRDDVERWIFLEMPIYNGYEKIERVVAMQTAKANQMVLINPPDTDYAAYKAIVASVDCWFYYSRSRHLPLNDGGDKFDIALEDKVYNTKERLREYLEYNHRASGRVTTATPTLKQKAQCETDIDKL